MRSVAECTLSFPGNMLHPEDLLHFVELDEFRDDWKAAGLDVENDLLALQIAIMADPEGPPVISGTGGLRKIRFAPADWHTGKRSAVRVCYVYIQEHWTVLLVMAYAKNEKLDLTAREKQGIREYIETIRTYLDSRSFT